MSDNDTRKLEFYGYSDDLAEIVGHRPGEPDEIPCDYPSDSATVEVRVDDTTDGLLVHWAYTQADTWAVGVAPLEDGMRLPDWEVWISTDMLTEDEPGCSTRLHVNAPRLATIRQVFPCPE